MSSPQVKPLQHCGECLECFPECFCICVWICVNLCVYGVYLGGGSLCISLGVSVYMSGAVCVCCTHIFVSLRTPLPKCMPACACVHLTCVFISMLSMCWVTLLLVCAWARVCIHTYIL